jgi:hypothetical protein
MFSVSGKYARATSLYSAWRFSVKGVSKNKWDDYPLVHVMCVDECTRSIWGE